MKRNGWKIAFLILLALIVLFVVWLFWDDGYEDDWEDDYGWDEDYDWDEDWHGGSGSGGYSGSAGGQGSGTISTVDNTASQAALSADEVVRDRLVTLKGNGEDTVTVLVYMNGSDLESEDGEATEDLSEMVAAGSSDRVKVVVETLGTKKWGSKYGISSKTAQRYELNGKGLTLVKDKLGSVECGSAAALTDFIRWGVKNYPADRYILQFWDHGGGPVYGFGYDDRTESEDSLTTAEMQKALRDAGAVFDFIGMDCCIMSSLEVGCALYDFCDYMILSEDFESGSGWSYTEWLRALYENSSLSTPELGKIIVDSMVKVNAKDGENAILAVIDESYMKLLYSGWVNFAYANEKTLLGTNYSRPKARKPGYRVSPILEKNGYFDRYGWDYDYGGEDDADLSEYYVTDIMAVAANISSEESEALEAALKRSIVYMSACGGSTDLTGISITLPYGDAEFYDELSEVLSDCGFDSDYIRWLEAFAESKNSTQYYDYGDWDHSWGGWDDYEDDYDWDDWGSDWDEEYWFGGHGGWGWSHEDRYR